MVLRFQPRSATAAKSSRRPEPALLLPVHDYTNTARDPDNGNTSAPIGCLALYGGSVVPVQLGAAIAVSMALPVEEWQLCAARRWAALDSALRERLAAASLYDTVRLGCGLLR